jgi:excisionase family DNA binding protein
MKKDDLTKLAKDPKYTHDEVFDDIRETSFTVKEAAEYLEIAEITLRRWVKAGNIKHNRVGRNIVFDPDELKSFKKTNRIKPKN